jgi:hypothetical protein
VAQELVHQAHQEAEAVHQVQAEGQIRLRVIQFPPDRGERMLTEIQAAIQLRQAISVQFQPQEAPGIIQFLQEAVLKAAHHTIQILIIVHLQDGLPTAEDHPIWVPPVHILPDHQVHQVHPDRHLVHHLLHQGPQVVVPLQGEGRLQIS